MAIISKSYLKVKPFKIPSDLTTPPNIQLLCINVQINFNKSFIVGCVYRHPNYLFETLENNNIFFHEFFTYLSMSNKNVYILGDFNLRNQKSISPLMNILNNLSISQLINEPTCGENMLDLIIVNNTDTVISINVYNPHLSDHAYTECVLKLSRPIPKKRNFQFRNYKNIVPDDVHRLMSDLKIENNASPEGATTIATSTILKTFDKLAPIKNKTVYIYSSKKFVSQATKKLIRERDQTYK